MLSVECTLAGYEGTELLLPLVGEVVPLQHPGARVLYAEPPKGLLELARLELAGPQWKELRQHWQSPTGLERSMRAHCRP